MKKILSKEIIVCDFCTDDSPAFTTCEPTGKDVCFKHKIEKEIRLPKELGGEMSGFKVIVDPDYLEKEAIFKIVIK
jgi:hypothetical protein